MLIRKHKAKSWLWMILCVDVTVFIFALLANYRYPEKNILDNTLMIGFMVILLLSNAWFVADYFLSRRAMMKESYRLDYAERQIRFALVCHVFDAAKNEYPVFFSQFSKAREWFFSRFNIEKSLRDEIAVCMSCISGSFRSSISFSSQLDEFLQDHPITDAYYTGLGFANANYPYIQSSRGFKGASENGMTLLFICETSFEFFEDRIENKLKSMLCNQQRAIIPLAKLFESKNMHNAVAVKLELRKLDIE